MERRHFIAGSVAALAARSAPAVAQARSVLKFVPQADLAALDPVFASALVTRTHGFLVYDTLYGWDENYQPQPQMAEGHVVDDDGKTWTITLREGLKFHDGTPVLSRDAIASIDRWTRTDPLGQGIRAVTNEMKVVSDRVLQIRLSKPYPLLPLALGKPSLFCPILPARLASTPPSVQVSDMTGSGPFRFVAAERVAGSRVVYEKFAGYVPRSSGTPGFLAGPKNVYVDRVE